MTAEEQERLWRFIELADQARIAYQTETAWEMHEAGIGPSPMLPAARAHRDTQAIAEYSNRRQMIVAQSRRRQ